MDPEERFVVETVRAFVDKDVRPVVRELQHANTYPEALIEAMKELGISTAWRSPSRGARRR